MTTPGCVDGWALLSATLGRLPLARTLEPAIEAAIDGYEVSKEQSRAFTIDASRYRSHPAAGDLYPGGEPPVPGAVVRRPRLGALLEAIAAEGRDAFYLGEAADDIVSEVGGMITRQDLAAAQAEWVDPISCRVAGLDAWTIPPNSQGYLGPATIAVFETLDPPADPDDPMWWHLLIEAYRSLAWERNDIVADPGTAPLPASLLLDPERLQRAAATVDRGATGTWPRMGGTSSTAYLCVADSEGLAVSIIQSNFEGPGSSFGSAAGGFLLHNRGAGFSLVPGHPNQIGPGKRPLHTLSPTLWTEAGRPRWLIGTRGGSVQPQLVAQLAARAVLAGEDLDRSQSSPRWAIADFGPYGSGRLGVEAGAPDGVLEELRRLGHPVDEVPAQPGWGPASIIGIGDAGLATARDPRVETTSALVF